MKITESRNEREGRYAGKDWDEKRHWRTHKTPYQLRYRRWLVERIEDDEIHLQSYWASV